MKKKEQPNDKVAADVSVLRIAGLVRGNVIEAERDPAGGQFAVGRVRLRCSRASPMSISLAWPSA